MIKGIWSTSQDDLSDAFMIREKVFIEEQGIDSNIEIDEFDEIAEHLIVYNNNSPVATGRLLNKGKQFLIGRVAVLKEFRGQKFGDFIIRMMVRRAFDKGAQEVHVHSQLNAKGFYEKLGFKIYGDVYEEAGIKHINMLRKSDFGCCCKSKKQKAKSKKQ